MVQQAERRILIRRVDDDANPFAGIGDDVRVGLGGFRKTLPPKYFYDARGSELFEEITRLPEYYSRATPDSSSFWARRSET